MISAPHPGFLVLCLNTGTPVEFSRARASLPDGSPTGVPAVFETINSLWDAGGYIDIMDTKWSWNGQHSSQDMMMNGPCWMCEPHSCLERQNNCLYQAQRLVCRLDSSLLPWWKLCWSARESVQSSRLSHAEDRARDCIRAWRHSMSQRYWDSTLETDAAVGECWFEIDTAVGQSWFEIVDRYDARKISTTRDWAKFQISPLFKKGEFRSLSSLPPCIHTFSSKATQYLLNLGGLEEYTQINWHGYFGKFCHCNPWGRVTARTQISGRLLIRVTR